MAIFPTSGITLSQVSQAFGDSQPYQLNELIAPPADGAIVPSGWQVNGKSAIPTSKSATNDLDRFRGGGYEPDQTATVSSRQGANVSGILSEEATAWGYSGFSGGYGSIGNGTNDEGWSVQAAIMLAGYTSLINKPAGLLVYLAYASEKLVNKISTNRLTITVSGGYILNGTYDSSLADGDTLATVGGVAVRELFWNRVIGGPVSFDYNPWMDNKTISARIQRLSYSV